MKKTHFSKLKMSAAPIVMGIALVSAPAFAQDAPADEGAATDDNTIVVTGSILRRTDTELASPVSVITKDDLANRGINTIDEAIQTLSANGAGTLPNSFTANGAFAAGASAASLRGLTTSSTLVLFDGMRAAYYPLADDGTRNFVDLNTIPDAVVERVEVLKDGASSTYGADAVAGVINIITKREVKGLHLGLETGISQRGDAANHRIEATWGVGDLDEDGFNVYVSGGYYHSDILYNRDRGYPYNTDDYSGICNSDGSDCVSTGVAQGRQFNGDFSGFTTLLPTFYSRPYDVAGGTPTAAGGYELLNPDAGCRGAGVTTLTPAEMADQNAAGPLLATNIMCQFDVTQQYGVIQPEQDRINGTLRATFRVSDDIQGYVQANYARSDVYYDFYTASAIRASAPAQSGITFNVNPLYLPVYICPTASPINNQPWNNGCDATNGTLNPNNPYAASGQVSRVLGNLPDIREESRYVSNAYRAAFGLNGSFADDWFFDVSGTAMKVDLKRTLKGRVYIANFLQAVADGSYNFVNPELNSQDVRDFVAPTVHNLSTSELYQLQASVSHDFFELPGGPLTVGLGASVRHERVNAPGADGDNSADPDLVDPTQRYTSRINPFGSRGQRTVWSVYGEVRAPVVDMVELELSGRYDSYSSGQSYFAPKAGVRIKPIPELLIRGTYSRGFRIGSFAEFGAAPTTGYVNGLGSIPEDVQDAYAAANGGTLPTYLTQYSLGLTQEGNPNLDPEKSQNLTVGFVFEPIRNVSFTVDYYEIKKTDVITGADYTPALAAYYAGEAIPEGFEVIADDPSTDPALAGLIPRVRFVRYSFENLFSQKVRGIDFGAQASFPITDNITWRTSLEASYLMELSQTDAGGKREFQGSIGPYVITSASGSPKWRGSWQNTLDFGGAYLTATAFYTDGYSTSAEDMTGPGTRNDCTKSQSATLYLSGDPFQCRVKDFLTVNLTAGFKVDDRFTFYANVINAFDTKAPLDTATYGGHLYNPAWANSGVLGRSFRVGVKADF